MKLSSFKTHVNRSPLLIGYNDVQNNVEFHIYIGAVSKTWIVINSKITSIRSELISSASHEA